MHCSVSNLQHDTNWPNPFFGSSHPHIQQSWPNICHMYWKCDLSCTFTPQTWRNPTSHSAWRTQSPPSGEGAWEAEKRFFKNAFYDSKISKMLDKIYLTWMKNGLMVVETWLLNNLSLTYLLNVTIMILTNLILTNLMPWNIWLHFISLSLMKLPKRSWIKRKRINTIIHKIWNVLEVGRKLSLVSQNQFNLKELPVNTPPQSKVSPIPNALKFLSGIMPTGRVNQRCFDISLLWTPRWLSVSPI